LIVTVTAIGRYRSRMFSRADKGGIMANARNSLPSAAERVRRERRVQQQGVERGRLSLPLFASCPLLHYALSQGIVEAPRGN